MLRAVGESAVTAEYYTPPYIRQKKGEIYHLKSNFFYFFFAFSLQAAINEAGYELSKTSFFFVILDEFRLRILSKTSFFWSILDESDKFSACKGTIAGNGVFSLFQFTRAISVYFSLLSVFSACKGTTQEDVGLGNSGTSMEMQAYTFSCLINRSGWFL